MPRTTLFAVTLVAALAAALPAAAQQSLAGREASGRTAMTDDQRAIANVVHELFDGMRAGDSTAVRSVLHPRVRMVTSSRRDGQPVVAVEESLDGFVEAVGTPHEEVWDERIWGLLIRTDGDFGMAWMNYAFYLGSRFSHCGVDLMELVRTADGWKIIGLADTRRREGCEVPASLD
ncbi:MAG TPA: nuclear transport factor 2 family protein [Longimicrobiales bacterium]|nr:nuclear transport factor 2 family protein [Longimicrobiales bacterium]